MTDDLDTIRTAALRVASRLVGATAAEDVAQETVLRAMPRLEEISRYAGPWAVRVATNLSLDLVRREARLSDRAVPERWTSAVDSELRLDLRRALARLPERQQQVVALRLLSDLDERTTAELLGISPGAVKRHLHRATTTLRTSPHIDAPPVRKAPAVSTYDWTTEFTTAVEPEGGWQGRPWDHWWLESRFGRVSRLAVIDGEPVLDAEGDEVMEGPGFDHHVVKVLPGVLDDEPEPELMPVQDVPGLLGQLLVEAREVSDAWGHPWVGDDHLVLVLAAHQAPGIPPLAAVEEAVARFYDGPFAPARLERVRARLAGAEYRRDPVPKVFTLPVKRLIATNAERALTMDDLTRRQLEDESSWLKRLDL